MIARMLERLLGYVMVSLQGRNRMVMPFRALDIEGIEAIVSNAVAAVVEMGGLWLEEG
jgi:hypothetical protein